MSPRARLWAGWFAGALLGGLSFLTLCDWSFDCGCLAPGLGDWRHCDIQTAGPPDCPWCERPAVSAIVFAIAAVSAWVAARVSALRLRWWAAVVAAWVAFSVATLAAGVVTALALGRPVLAGF